MKTYYIKSNAQLVIKAIELLKKTDYTDKELYKDELRNMRDELSNYKNSNWDDIDSKFQEEFNIPGNSSNAILILNEDIERLIDWINYRLIKL